MEGEYNNVRYHLPVTDSLSSSRERIMQSVITNTVILLISITIKSSSLQEVVWLSVRVEWWEGGCNMVTALSFTLWKESERGWCWGRRVRGGGGIES